MDQPPHQKIAEAWEEIDPIVYMENYLRNRGIWSDDWKQKITDEINREIYDAVEFTNNSPSPESEKLAAFGVATAPGD